MCASSLATGQAFLCLFGCQRLLLLYLPTKLRREKLGRSKCWEFRLVNEELGLIQSFVIAPKGRSRAYPSRGRDTKNKAYPERKGLGPSQQRVGKEGKVNCQWEMDSNTEDVHVETDNLVSLALKLTIFYWNVRKFFS